MRITKVTTEAAATRNDTNHANNAERFHPDIDGLFRETTRPAALHGTVKSNGDDHLRATAARDLASALSLFMQTIDDNTDRAREATTKP